MPSLAVRGLLAALLFTLTTPVAAQPRESPATSMIAFRSDLPSRYLLEQVRIRVDGYIWADGPVATVAPGTHDVVVIAEFRVRGQRPHAHDVRFEAHSAERVTVQPRVVLVARAVEVGAPTDPPEKRVRVLWR